MISHQQQSEYVELGFARSGTKLYYYELLGLIDSLEILLLNFDIKFNQFNHA